MKLDGRPLASEALVLWQMLVEIPRGFSRSLTELHVRSLVESGGRASGH